MICLDRLRCDGRLGVQGRLTTMPTPRKYPRKPAERAIRLCLYALVGPVRARGASGARETGTGDDTWGLGRSRYARYLVGGPGWSGAGPVAVGIMSCPCPQMIRGVLSPAAAGRWGALIRGTAHCV